jgi:hypothetical protein
LGIATLAYAYRSKTITQHPSQRGLFIGTGLALLGTAFWFTLQRTTPKFSADNLLTTAMIIFSIPLYALIIASPFARKSGGSLLYEVRRPRSRKFSGFATAALFLILGLMTVIQTGFTRETIAEMVFYVSVVLYFGLPMFGKVELRQEGILESYTLLHWKDITSYRWIGEGESNLSLTIKSVWRKSATIALPPDQKEAVQAILGQRVGVS